MIRKAWKRGEFYGLPRLDAKIQLWTDGSLQSDGQAGAGLYISGGLERQGFRLGEGVSIWQAELYAIYRGCLWILANTEEVENEKVVFNVDSQSAIIALQKVEFNSLMLGKTMDALIEAAQACIGKELKGSLVIRWVKSHQDSNPLYLGNCNADALAVSAAQSEGPVVEDKPKPTKGTWKMDLRQKVDGLWGHMVKSLPPPNSIRQTKQWFAYPQAAKSLRIVNLPRQQFGKMVQLITGHNYLNRHEFLIKGPKDEEVDPMCQLCDYNYCQTSAHVIGECPALMGPRLEVFSLHTMEPPFDFDIKSIIKFLHLANINALCMKDTNESAEGVNQTS